jgi:hypothetical protein
MNLSTVYHHAGGLLRFAASAARDIEYAVVREPGLLLVVGALLVLFSVALLKVR